MSDLLNKKLLVIGSGKPGPSTKMLLDIAKKAIKTVDYVPVNSIVLNLGNKGPQITYNKKDLTKYDYCLPRIDSKRAQHGYHVIKFMDMVHMKKPYAAEAILIAHNKFTTLEVLKSAGVPIPQTFLVGSVDATRELLKKVDYPIVIKIVDSFGGQGVMMLDDEESAKSAIETLKRLNQQTIVEEFLESKAEDIRAFIVGGEIIASMKRKAKKGELRANLFLGGKAEYITIKGEMEEIALKAAKAVGSDIVAIDLMDTRDGPKVIEVNLNPGIKGIQKVAGINIFEKIVDFIKAKI